MTYTVTMMNGYYKVTVKNMDGVVVNVVTATTKIGALRRARWN